MLAGLDAYGHVVQHERAVAVAGGDELDAYPDRPGQIRVSAWAAGSELVVVIADDGNGFRANSDRPGLGVGLGLIATLSDEFEIVQLPSGGTEVQMRFWLSA